jgi:hypothetical protein
LKFFEFQLASVWKLLAVKEKPDEPLAKGVLILILRLDNKFEREKPGAADAPEVRTAREKKTGESNISLRDMSNENYNEC